MDVKTLHTDAISFHEMFCTPLPLESSEDLITITDIEIPRIQRDYAQGRLMKSVKKVRSRFLDALYNTLTTAGESLMLDFVYGDIEQRKDKYTFIPIDGQQRLTTLFLLYWFAAKKERIACEKSAFLEHFSYATRYSSRDFCCSLVNYSPDWNNLLKDNQGNPQLSLTIADQPWYPFEWRNDPTIQSMLVMLDAIYHKFAKVDGLWSTLVEEKRIKFYCRLLKDMGLTDELYIKMNSRGKPLTDFEHFKAEFEDIIRQQDEALAMEFSHKIDIEWTDMLFPYCGSNNIVDEEFMHYYKFISHILCYLNDYDLCEDELELAKHLYKGEHGIENLKYLKSAFDCWCGIDIDAFFNEYFTSTKYSSGKVKLYQEDVNLFRECCKSSDFLMRKILMLYAVVVYRQHLMQSPELQITETQFRRRIRIIRNLIQNSEFEIRHYTQRGENQMKRLLEETHSIMTTGCIPDQEVRGYNSRQKSEELSKEKWLVSNSSWADELFHLEDHALLRGSIQVVGLDNCDNFNKFRLLFNNCNKQLIDGALLTIGNYSQQIGWRTQLGIDNDEIWKELLHKSSQRGNFDETSRVINKLLSQFPTIESICDDTLKTIIDKYLEENQNEPKDWRYYFIKYACMRNVGFGMYFWKDKNAEPYNIIMMGTKSSRNGRNWNLFLYFISKLIPESELGEYAYSGNGALQLGKYKMECYNDRFIIKDSQGQHKEYNIPQIEGIDIDDRVERGVKLCAQIDSIV